MNNESANYKQTQLSRVRGQASEEFFASRYHSWIENEDQQLLSPTLDRGWDYMIEKNGIKIQVKRFNPIGKNRNQNQVKLKRTRTASGNYTDDAWGYLVVHDVTNDNLIVADVAQCLNKEGKMKTSVSVYPTRKSKGLNDLGFEVFK